VPDDRRDAGGVRARITCDPATQTAGDEAFADVRDQHGMAQTPPEQAPHVRCSRVSGSGGAQVDELAGRQVRGDVRRGYGAEEISGRRG